MSEQELTFLQDMKLQEPIACDLCGETVNLSQPYVIEVNDGEVELPYHATCYEKVITEAPDGMRHGNVAHFQWPPSDAEQHAVYREFLADLQEHVATLPYPIELLCHKCARVFVVETMGFDDDSRNQLRKSHYVTCLECQVPEVGTLTDAELQEAAREDED